ncbi:MAG: DUF4271 domain-containing protein [Bacteroidales bacterium]|jgi:hypothetical protein|nr:DUF4271 domain-containing protein [Bacteroidales bacterium]
MSRIHNANDTTLSLQSIDLPQAEYTSSVFTSHLLTPGTFRAREHPQINQDWILGMLIFCFILLAWTQVFYSKRIRQIFRAPLSKRFLNQLVRDGNLFNERVTLTFGLVYLLVVSLLLYQLNEQLWGLNFFGLRNITLFLAILFLFFGYWVIKFMLIRFLGVVFKTRETTFNYLLNLLIFCLITGPVILAFLVFIIYLKSDVLLFCCLIVFSLLFIFRVMRGFFIGSGLRKFSYLFLFVYLCSLEILPLLVLIKLLLNFMHSLNM